MKTHRVIVGLTAAAWIAHVSLSLPLWYSKAGRTFPLLPLWAEAHRASSALAEAIALGAIAAGLIAATAWPYRRAYLALACGGMCVLVTLDLNRAQPWLYFYLLIWAALLGTKEARSAEQAVRLVVTGVYAWSGIYKLSPYFAEDNFPWFCNAFSWTRPLGAYPLLGYAVAAGEALLAVGLLWRPCRPYFRYIAVLFHLFILLALSPIRLNWNSVVIPWNAAMALLVWLLFSPEKGAAATASLPQRVSPVVLFVGGLTWVMPALNAIGGWWPEAFSWKMYSNTQPEAGFFTSDAHKLCPEVRAAWRKHAWGGTPERLLFDDWAMDNLRVPMFNSRRTHTQLAQYLCRCSGATSKAGWWRMEVAPWRRGAERWQEVLCTQRQ